MKEAYTATELSAILGITDRAVRKKGWEYREELNPRGGGSVKLYIAAKLPEDVRIAIASNDGKTAITDLQPAASSPSLPVPATCPYPLTESQQKDALARADLVRLYISYTKRNKRWGRRGQVKQDFLLLYNNGAYPHLLEQIGKTSVKTLDRWVLILKRSNDPFALADTRGKHRKGHKAVTPEQAAILTRFALSPNRPAISEVIRIARARMEMDGIQVQASDATLRRLLIDFMKEHYPEWVFHREGQKALNEKCLYHVTRDCNRLQVGDMIVADGHTFNFEIINPWTGKPKRMALILWFDMKSSYPLGWEIMPTENTQAITSALRRAILALGKMPKVAYMDNGKAFRSKFFNSVADFRQAAFVGLFERLGIDTVFAWKYHAESKPVERFFKSFGELERLAPSYVGTSIATKPPRMNRGEFVHRRLYEKMTGGRIPTLIEAHQAIAAWFDEYSTRKRRSGHLKGKRPVDVFLEEKGPGIGAYQREQLRLLMMRHEVRRIGRDGIRISGVDENYYAPELYGMQMQPGIVLYDMQDMDSICVYDMDNNFICEARRMDKLHPAAGVLGTVEDREKVRAQIEMKRSLEKKTIGPARAFLESEVLPEVRKHMESVGFEAGELPAVQQAARLPTLTRNDRLKIGEPSEEELEAEIARIESYDIGGFDPSDDEKGAQDAAAIERRLQESGEIQLGPDLHDRPIFTNAVDRYRWCLEQLAAGRTLHPDDVLEMDAFESKMDDATAAYWDIVKETIQGKMESA